MSKALRIILGDQLSLDISTLEDCDKTHDIILMCEVWDEATYVKHHKKKIAVLFSAMRHFAEELKANGYSVIYTKLDDPDNAGSFKGEVARILKEHDLERIIATHPGEYRVFDDMLGWENAFSVPVEIREDTRFLCSIEEFERWTEGRKELRMEYFYREMRKKHDILMEGDKPAAYFNAMISRAKTGDLKLHQSVMGHLKREFSNEEGVNKNAKAEF